VVARATAAATAGLETARLNTKEDDMAETLVGDATATLAGKATILASVVALVLEVPLPLDPPLVLMPPLEVLLPASPPPPPQADSDNIRIDSVYKTTIRE